MKLCKIIVVSDDDYKFLQKKLKGYPIVLSQNINFEESIDTLLVGWSVVKENFEGHNIFDEKITENISWAFSKDEDEEKFISSVEGQEW